MQERELLIFKGFFLPEPKYNPLKQPFEYLYNLADETGHLAIKFGRKTIHIWQDLEDNTWFPNIEAPHVLIQVRDPLYPNEVARYLIDQNGLRFYQNTGHVTVGLTGLGNATLTPEEFHQCALIQAACVATFVYNVRKNDRCPQQVTFECRNTIQ